MTITSLQTGEDNGRRRRWPLVPGTCLLLAGAVGLLSGCEINKPELPTFDTRLNIPLGMERIDIMDMVQDESFLIVGSDSSLGFFIEGEPDTFAFGFELGADFPSQSIQQGMGNFDLQAGAPMAYAFDLATIWPVADGMIDQTTLVPSFPIDETSPGQNIPDISSATLEAGVVTVTVTNGLPVPISADSGPDQVILEMIDPGTGLSFATFYFPEIAPSGESAQSADLTGVDLPGEVAVRLNGGSAGSSGAMVIVSGSDAISIAAEFKDLVVSSATAAVGAQTFLTNFDTALPADFEITSAVISSGSLSMAVSNGMPVPCTALVTWPNVVSLTGQTLTATFPLAAGQSVSRNIDFSGCLLQSDGIPLTTLAADVEINTPGSGGIPVTMSSEDGLTADISSGSIAFSTVTGIVPEYAVDLDPTVQSIDLPAELDGLEMTSATMVLRLTNSARLPGDLDLTLTGISAAGLSRSLVVTETIAPAQDRAAQTTSIVLNESNSDILEFLNNMPESIFLAGSVQVGGNGAVGTVHPNDYAVVSWEINAPVEVVVLGSTFTADPQMVNLEQDMRDRIDNHALGAFIQTEILNHLPIGVEIRILAGTDLATLQTSPLLAIGPLAVESALVDPVTHTVAEAVTSYPVVELTSEQARIFSTPGLITTVEVHIPSTEGLSVRMMSTDFLEVRGLVQVDLHVSDQW